MLCFAPISLYQPVDWEWFSIQIEGSFYNKINSTHGNCEQSGQSCELCAFRNSPQNGNQKYTDNCHNIAENPAVEVNLFEEAFVRCHEKRNSLLTIIFEW